MSTEDLLVKLKRYEKISLLGKGGMGIVYKVFDNELERFLAIKFIETACNKERFRSEAKTMARLDHPNIIPIYDIGEINNTPYFTMKYIDGVTLNNLTFKNKIEITEALLYLIKIIDAIDYAHQCNVIHRDVKSSNIIISKKNKAFIMDFGLAKNIIKNNDITLSGTLLGTPHYMSPEQASGKIEEVDALSDVYSLGVVLYEIITGRLPFSGKGMPLLIKIIASEILPFQSGYWEIPKELKNICSKAMSKKKADRYASANFMAKEIKNFCLLNYDVKKNESAIDTINRIETKRLSSVFKNMDFSFSLDSIPVTDVLQMALEKKWTGTLFVNHLKKKCHIYFEEGNLRTCKMGLFEGQNAFYSLLTWVEGKGLFVQEKKTVESQFNKDTVFYIFEGMRLLDEWKQMSQQIFVKDNIFCESLSIEKKFLIDAICDNPIGIFIDKLKLEKIELYFLVKELVKNKWIKIDFEETEFNSKVSQIKSINVNIKPINVMIIEDSMIVRKILKRILLVNPNIQKIWEFKSLTQATLEISELSPNVVILDVSLPDMSIKNILALRKEKDLPIIMLSNQTEEEMEITFECLCKHAIDFIGKPKNKDSLKIMEKKGTLISEKVKHVANFPIEIYDRGKTFFPLDKILDVKVPADKILFLAGGVGSFLPMMQFFNLLPEAKNTTIIFLLYISEQHLPLFIEQAQKYSKWILKNASVGEIAHVNHVYFVAASAYLGKIIKKVDDITLKAEFNIDLMNDARCWITLDKSLENTNNTILIFPGIGEEIIETGKKIEKTGGEMLFLKEWRDSTINLDCSWIDKHTTTIPSFIKKYIL